MSWINSKYESKLRNYNKKDGLKAIILYFLIMLSLFFQGWLYTVNVSTFVLNSSQIWLPLIRLIIFLFFLHCSKEKISSVGINADNIKHSIMLGVIGGGLLLILQTVLFIAQGKAISFSSPMLLTWVIFIFAALEEEVLFRGYIQTRMSGLINRQWIVGIINSLLFLTIHYPVRWVVSAAVSFDVLSGVYVISLLALHFFCDAVYKRTNCLWGAVVLHIIYNAIGAMIAVQ